MTRRPCWVEVSTGAFEQNYRLLASTCSSDASDSDGPASAAVELLAIVKADAYGHGLTLCAPAAVRAGARWLGVTSVEEGLAARAVCPGAEILVIGGIFAGQGADIVAAGLTPVVWDVLQLDELEGALEGAALAAGLGPGAVKVHLELDTGMSRQGVPSGNLDAILARFSALSWLRLAGLMTHLYAADESDGVATGEQMAVLEPMVWRVFEAGLRPEWLNVGNSAAVLAGDPLHAMRALCKRFEMKPMARPGLALYGLAPEFVPEEPASVARLRDGLERVLEWKTCVVSLWSVEPGQAVGYNGTFVATEMMRLALLAVGYADGLKRSLSNRGAVLVGGQRAPIVGRISMDQTVVDVTEIPGVAPGDEVVLLGWQGVETITAEEHARWAGTIPWEIFTSIASRVERREMRSWK